ncbi:hypothetical protein AUEXF2481DRAFT_24692 [Aureobasidium subglaciale EXF-2481]|uniref:LIM zinc-binding domain-containing protein n=1 Tax=Aureobasidium subglaciale (strain EXF-2481) TaxID=1043005 RepID=A0A074YRG6_AURSE|nr:uncharacterized protein AUEXF2481DRAFT_24692 [Aureobasidium subglaciale EXF-2481]KER00354.1 hypothetical protein AUEXF2481DRAFT_24692 [Aureobasidium subglaciale EXF-2481]
MALDNHTNQQLGQHIHFSPPKTPHSPRKPSPLRQCQRLSSIPDYEKINNLHDDNSATYLQDLRNNRVARLNGSRPPPPSRIASKRQPQRPTSSDDSTLATTNKSVPTHNRQKSLDSISRDEYTGRPLVAQPGLSNVSKVSPLASQPIHEALEELNLEEEKRIHAAAQDEAAELVWKHRTGHDPEKERASAYTNPDVDPKAARKDYRAHLRSTSKDKNEVQPLFASRSAGSDAPVTSLDERGNRKLPEDPFVEPTTITTPLSASRSTRSKGKSYEGLANAVANDVAVSKRRVSSGSKRRPSSEVKAGFMNPTDKIYEEPDEPLEEVRDVEAPAITTQVETKPEEVPRHVRRNPFARVRLAQEKFEKKESPSGYSVKKNDEKEHEKISEKVSVSGYTAKKHEKIEIQRNPPSQSRNAFYTVNESAPASPNLPPQDIPERAVEDSPKVKDGKEVRGDDIRSATAMKRKDRSPNLPQPTAVSDSPGRPIVSFQSGWKPKEIQLVEEKSIALPECLAVGKNAPSSAALSGKQRRYSLPHSQQGPPPLPKIILPDEPQARSTGISGSTPMIARISVDIPMIVLPDDPIASPSKTLSEEPDIPGLSLSSSTIKPPVFVIDAPSSAKDDRPPPLQHRPQSSPPKTSSPFSKRPLPTPTPAPARPLPVPSKTSPFPTVSKPHMTPSVRRNTALCAHCALPIAGRILSAAGERFHPSCFKCHECGINLECVAFYPEPEKKRGERLARIRQRQRGLEMQIPAGVTEEDIRRLEEQDGDESLRFFCGLDFHEFFSPRCKSCKTPIEGEVVVACGAEWHVGHFFCAQCGDPFDSTTPFVEKEGYAWCVGCHTNRYSAKCRKCRRPVTDVVIKALGADWHADCFCCTECGDGFDDGRYFLRGNNQDPRLHWIFFSKAEGALGGSLNKVNSSIIYRGLFPQTRNTFCSFQYHTDQWPVMEAYESRRCMQLLEATNICSILSCQLNGRFPKFHHSRGNTEQFPYPPKALARSPPESATSFIQHLSSKTALSEYSSLIAVWYHRSPVRSHHHALGTDEPLALAPKLIFETPSSGSARAVLEEIQSTTEAPSVYYTASWGSPCTRPTQDPSGPSAQGTPIASPRHTESESPSFNLEHLVPSRVAVQERDFSGPSFGLDHLLPSRIPIQHHIASPITTERLAQQEDTTQSVAQRPSRHTITRRLTEDWVQQYTTGKWRSERGNWLSDESGDSNSGSEDEEDFKTPIPFTWFSGRHRRKNTSASPLFDRQQRPVSHDSFKRGHKSRESNLTLKQEDFLQFTRQLDGSDMSIFTSKWALSPQKEKPLPPPPAPPGDIRSTGNSPNKNNQLPPLPSPNSDMQRPTPPPRPRTKLAWRGKACWIALPSMAPEAYGGDKPLSKTETETRLKRFEEEGYNVNGFDLQPWAYHDSIASQSSGQYPDDSEHVIKRQQKDYKVFVPNPQTWKSYVDELMEQKLRALGVSLGDDLAPAQPPPMSRQSSGHYQSVSPNLMHSTMAGASHRSTPSLAHFPTPGHSYSASVASPLSMPGDPRGHAHRHSVFGMPGMPFGFPGQQNQPNGLPAFSPSTNFSMNGLHRGGSPALERLKSEGPPAKSPVSPYGMPSPYARSPHPQSGDWSGQAHLRHQSVYSSFSPQSQAQRSITPTLTPGAAMRTIPSLAEVPEDEEEPMQDYFAGATPRRQTRKEVELAHPSPRHNRNISDALEREIQGSDYHLEKSFERQLQDEEDEVNNSFASHTSSNGTYVPPGKRSSLVQSTNGFASRNDSPSLENVPAKPQKEDLVTIGLTGAPQNKTTNKVKGHVSRLSVAAPEFKFQPGSAFQPTLPSLPGVSNFGPPVQNNIRVPSGGNLDMAAAAFQPAAFGVMPSSDFNFASAFPFNPVAQVQQPVVHEIQSQIAAPSIFGDVNMLDATKPARRSKAVAITQPKSSPVKEEPEAEDEDGRAAQSEDRQKRARVGQEDGNDVPLFAERPASRDQRVTQGPTSGEKDESSNAQDGPQSGAIEKTAQLEKTTPTSDKKHTARLLADIASTRASETLPEIPTVNGGQGHKKNSSSLSALAKPFEFKAQGSMSSNQPLETLLRSPDPNKTKPDFSPSRVFSRTSEKTQASVEDLDYAPSPEPQKHMPYPIDNINEGSRFPEPTFDEIDAVMQQLNDDDGYDQFQQEFASEVASPHASVIHHSPRQDDKDRSISPLPSLSREQVRVRPARISRLNRGEEIPLSEWSDDLSVDEASKLRSRSNFFDDRVDQIVGGVIDHRLAPLEKSLQMIHRAVSTIMTRESAPVTTRAMSVDDSDADDEDETVDERQPFRTMSRAQERKVSQIKAAVLEALASQKANGSHFSSATEIHNALMDMNTTIARIASANLDIDDVKHVVDESLHRMGQTLTTPSALVVDTEVVHRHKREVSELNNRLNKTLADALEEANQRRNIEEREADTRRLLRLAEEELSLLRKTVGDKEQRIHSLENQREELEIRVDSAEVTHAHDRKQLSDFEAENSALESTIEEYRLSSMKWRNEVDEVTGQNEALKASVLDLNAQVEETRETIRLAHQQIENAVIENVALKSSSAELLSQLEESQAFGKQARQAADDAAIEATAIKASAAELMLQLEQSHAFVKQVQQTADDAAAENTALKASVTSLVAELEESRLYAKKWKHEAEVAARENANIHESMSDLKNQIADGLSIRENMRSKLDKIHHGMISAAEQLANEKAIWQNRNEELQKRYVVQQARLEGEVSIRRSIEEEIQSLRTQVHEAVTTKIQLEQLQRSTCLHEETLRSLRDNLTSEQTLNARLERDLHEARESGRAEVQRTQMIMQSSIEAAESQANITRASLEHEIMLTKNEIDNIKMVSDDARERHERSLEQEADLRRDALRKVNETSSAALNDLREKHAEEIRYLKSQYERSVANAYEDKQRSAVHFNDRLELSNDQVLHLRDKVAHLEERLNVARSAAQAAAQAAKSAPAATSMSKSTSREEPEKISPQALRESILVLQEQLQERETRVERLQSEIANVDTTAPSKLKEKDVEISWLRELLSVRNEDLNQLVDTLSKSDYDRDAVRDFAIRIRANLQMEQQEKERLINAGPSLTGQALANLTNFASPKAVSLAAAFGNWRKSRETSRPAAAPKAPATRATARSSAAAARMANGRTQTPSKPSPLPSPSVLSGLMTPPSTNFRRTPGPVDEPSGSQRSSLSFSHAPQQDDSEAQMTYFDTTHNEQGGESPMVFRRQSYDEDAQLGDIDTSIGADDEEEQEVVNMDDEVQDSHDQTPEELVGRSLASELEAM